MKKSKASTPIAILRILQQHSDEDHLLTQGNILQYLLSEYNISLERKAVARHIEEINNSGYQIIKVSRKDDINNVGGYYYHYKNEFNSAQWKIIASAIQAATFISKDDAKDMSKKIISYVNEYNEKEIRSYNIINSKKNQNNNITKNIEIICKAISQKHSIYFNYFNYYQQGKPKFLGTKETRHVVPCATAWSGDRFYLIGYLCDDDPRNQKKKPIEERNFRIDKIINIKMNENDKVKNTFPGLDESTKQKLGMFSGEAQIVKMKTNDRGLSQILDRFDQESNDIHMKQTNDSVYPYEISFAVESSPVLFGWLTQISTDALIISKKTQNQYLERLKSIISLYE